ncbi:MAG: SDR family oxidoreductase [Bacteroidales bacterium]
MYFSGKIVWITGASSGIGEELAVSVAAQGGTVVLSARSLEQLQRVQNRCTEAGGKSEIVILDLSSQESIQKAATDVLGKFGRIDVLVNNGGISQRGLVHETAIEVDRRIMEVNFFGAVALTKAVLPGMLVQEDGHIVVLSSVVGKIGFPVRSAYSASKHALHGFFETLWAEYHDAGIRVTMICPGMVRTNISFHALEGNGKEHGVMDDRQNNGISAAACAKIIVRSIKRNRREVYIGREQILIYLRRYFPWLFFRIVSRFKPV